MPDQPLEIIVYIHGVSPRGQRSHQQTYQVLHDAIRARQRPGRQFPDWFCGVEWGWHEPAAQNPKSHELLSDAEEALGARALPAVLDPWDFTINPLRIAVDKFRPLMLYNFADMFYYASEDGKNAVRYAAAKRIIDCLRDKVGDISKAPPLSLTFLAHSAGSIVAFDLLFYLFYAPRPVSEFINAAKVKAGPAHPDNGVRSFTASPNQVQQTLSELEMLKQMAQQKQSLRVRRLFTFGSPITPLSVRSDVTLGILAGNHRLSPGDYGLTRNDALFAPALQPPRWVNIWDKDDPIAWPVEPLMDAAGGAVKDEYIDVSDDVTAAHNEYWGNARFQQLIADRW